LTEKVNPTPRKNSDGTEPAYLGLRAAAKWAGVSEKTIKRWLKRGLPTYQAGPREKILLKREDIDRFLTQKRVSQVDLNKLVEDTLRDLKSP